MTFAVVFPGQGSQFEGMADPWTTHPAGQAVLEEASEAMERDIVAGCHDPDALATTEFAQPALLACGVAAFRVLEAEGLRSERLAGAAGHSLGEFAALVAAGTMLLPEALALVVVRGEAMQRAGEARPGHDECADRRRYRDRGGALRRSARGRRPAGRQPELPRAGRDQRQRRGDRARRGAREGAEDPGDPAQRGRCVPLAADGTGGGADPAHARRHRAPDARVPDRRERERHAGRRSGRAHGRCWGATSSRRCCGNATRRRSPRPGATTFLEAGPGDVLTKMAKRVVPGATALAVGTPEAAAAAVSSAP